MINKRPLKERIGWCICSTFLSGMYTAITASFIDCKQPIDEILVFGIISLISIILTAILWKYIFAEIKF